MIILDNNSTDGSRDWLKQLKHPQIRVKLNEKNLGKGGSIRKGITLSKGKFIIIHDSDLEYQANKIWKLLAQAIKTNASFVLGSRLLNQKPKFIYIQNYFGVVFLTTIIRWLYGCKITDSATAMKLMDGNILRNLKLSSKGFNSDFELITRIARLGGSFSEVSISYKPRTIREGKKIRPIVDGISSLAVILRDRLLPKSAFIKSDSFANKPNL